MSAQKALPATDLSSAFAKPTSRAGGLRLPPSKTTQKPHNGPQRPVTSTPAPEPDDEPTDTPRGSQKAPEAPSATSKPRKRTKKPSTKAETQTASATPAARATTEPPRRTPRRTVDHSDRLVLWTPKSIRARMKAVQIANGTLYRDQVLDALEATVEHLPDLIANATTTPHVQGKLFERAVPDTPDTHSRDKVQLTISGFLISQLEVIDQLVESSGAGSRSAMVNAALDATLPTTHPTGLSTD